MLDKVLTISILCVPEMTQALKTVVRYSGIPGLWMGLSSTLLRDVPFSAIYWLNYETIKKIFYTSQQTFTFNLAAGAVAGSVCIFMKICFIIKYFICYCFNYNTIVTDSSIFHYSI